MLASAKQFSLGREHRSISPVEAEYRERQRKGEAVNTRQLLITDFGRDLDDKVAIEKALYNHLRHKEHSKIAGIIVSIEPEKERAGALNVWLNSFGFNHKDNTDDMIIPIGVGSKGAEKGREATKSYEKHLYYTGANQPAKAIQELEQDPYQLNGGQTEYFGHVAPLKTLKPLQESCKVFRNVYEEAERDDTYINVALMTSSGDLMHCIEQLNNDDDEETRTLFNRRTLHISIQGDVRIKEDGIETPHSDGTNNLFNEEAAHTLYRYMNENEIMHTTFTKGLAYAANIFFRNLEAQEVTPVPGKKGTFLSADQLLEAGMMPSEIASWIIRNQLAMRFLEDPSTNRMYIFPSSGAVGVIWKLKATFDFLCSRDDTPREVVRKFFDIKEPTLDDEGNNFADGEEWMQNLRQHLKTKGTEAELSPGWDRSILYDVFAMHNSDPSTRQSHADKYLCAGFGCIAGLKDAQWSIPGRVADSEEGRKLKELIDAWAPEIEVTLTTFNNEQREIYFARNPESKSTLQQSINMKDLEWYQAHDNISNDGIIFEHLPDRFYNAQTNALDGDGFPYISSKVGVEGSYKSPVSQGVDVVAYVSDDETEYPNGAQYALADNGEYVVINWISDDRHTLHQTSAEGGDIV